MNILFVFLILAVVAIFGVWLANFLNRDIKCLIAQAEKIAKNRLHENESCSIDDFLKKEFSTETSPQNIKLGLQVLLEIFELGSQVRFKSSDSMGELFRVYREELQDVDSAWKKAGLEEYIEVFSDELLDKTSQSLGKDHFLKFLMKLGVEESERDAQKDVLMGLSVKGYLLAAQQ